MKFDFSGGRNEVYWYFSQFWKITNYIPKYWTRYFKKRSIDGEKATT